MRFATFALLATYGFLLPQGTRGEPKGRAIADLYEVAAIPEPTEIDRLVSESLKAYKLELAPLCNDSVFIRRVYLDLTGSLPPPKSVVAFLRSEEPAKRADLIDRLMDSEDYALYQSLRWGDALRIKSEFPINLWPNAVQAYSQWVLDAVRDNMPYDTFARALLTSSGSNFRVPPVNFYRAVQNTDANSLASAVALTFMGTRLEKWQEADRMKMEAFFDDVAFKPADDWPTATRSSKSMMRPNRRPTT